MSKGKGTVADSESGTELGETRRHNPTTAIEAVETEGTTLTEANEGHRNVFGNGLSSRTGGDVETFFRLNPPYQPSPEERAKKLPPYLEREIVVKNPDKVNKVKLLLTMKEEFSNGFWDWKRESNRFKFANLVVTVLVILIQVIQVILFQVPSLKDSPDREALATILPAITGAILALQLKLSWAEKAYKAKKTANMYYRLVRHMDYRNHMLEANGEMDDADAIKIWNTAMLMEHKGTPAFLSCC